MTQSLVDVFMRGRAGFDKGDERVTWPEMFDAIQAELHKRFVALKKSLDPAEQGANDLEKQRSQTLYQFTHLPGAVASRSQKTQSATGSKTSSFLEVEVPEGTALFLDGKPIPVTGSKRVFVSLPQSAGRDGKYTLTAQRVVNGEHQTVVQFVEAAVGETTHVVIEFPPATASR
jgi:uncharacterized protein (TIGR03000 family)